MGSRVITVSKLMTCERKYAFEPCCKLFASLIRGLLCIIRCRRHFVFYHGVEIFWRPLSSNSNISQKQNKKSFVKLCDVTIRSDVREIRRPGKKLSWRPCFLHKSQSGFRQGRSTLDHTLRLHDLVYKFVIDQKSVLAVFLDFQSAYDMQWRDGLISKLFQLGIRGNMLKWIRSVISSRTLQVRIGTEMFGICVMENGIPARFYSRSW